VVTDSPDEKRQPQVVVRPEGASGSRSEAKKYLMPTHAHLMVRDGEEVHAGAVIAKIPRETTKTKDITATQRVPRAARGGTVRSAQGA
jgi:DNA-directed RNA polymerase subunit beta'